jgi:hypothetical protein
MIYKINNKRIAQLVSLIHHRIVIKAKEQVYLIIQLNYAEDKEIVKYLKTLILGIYKLNLYEKNFNFFIKIN